LVHYTFIFLNFESINILTATSLSIKQHFSYFLNLLIITTFVSLANAQNDTAVFVADSIAIRFDSTELKVDTIEKVVKEPKSVKEEIDSLSVTYFTGTIDNLKMDNLQYIDTSTFYFQQFDQLFQKNGLYSTLSNIGLAHSNLVFSPALSIDYHFENQSFSKYIYENQQVKYYNLYIPYTEISYVLGSKKEQNFQVVFNRELIKRLTIGVDFALNNSPGPYANNKADDKRLFFTGQYYTKNRRYGVIANYLYNKLIVQENGGIRYDSVFEENTESDRD